LVSIGIIAWNEEKALRDASNPFFQQSLFADCPARAACEIFYYPPAARTHAEVVAKYLRDQNRGNILKRERIFLPAGS